MVIDSVSDEASLLLPLLENQYDDIVSSQFVLKFMYVCGYTRGVYFV